MTEFKSKLRFRAILLCAFAIATLLVGLIFGFFVPSKDEQVVSFIDGFRVGFFIAIASFAIANAVSLFCVSKNPDKLKALYIKETDERTVMILQKTYAFVLSTALTIIAFSSLIASFYNTTIFFTLVAVVLFLAALQLVTHIYFNLKY